MLAGLIVAFVVFSREVPETKGRSMEEIEQQVGSAVG